MGGKIVSKILQKEGGTIIAGELLFCCSKERTLTVWVTRPIEKRSRRSRKGAMWKRSTYIEGGGRDQKIGEKGGHRRGGIRDELILIGKGGGGKLRSLSLRWGGQGKKKDQESED